jgi:NodT family efflux transporter outer membrane factor (OMF) lipoprotein
VWKETDTTDNARATATRQGDTLMFRSLHNMGAAIAAAVLAVSLSGCTSFQDYINNGFKVGPNYCPPKAPVAEQWIDAAQVRQPADTDSLTRWWTVFNDPKLNYLVARAYRQNLTLREAGFRVLQARAQLAIAVGEIFPQQQSLSGSYRRLGTPFTDLWSYGFNLQWELDFWGQFRRAVAAADAQLDASVEGYDAAIVTMLGDVAQYYVQIRTDQERIVVLRANADLQRRVLEKYIMPRFNVGFKLTALDKDQAEATLKQTEAAIPLVEIDMRQAENALCVLLGMPPGDLRNLLGTGPIPTCPPEVAIGIPADLLRRRPDVRQAERLAAAQAEQIGIAQADLYPSFYVNGSLGYSAQNFHDLFKSSAFNGSVGPSFQWNLLNYGRIVNNVRSQDAQFQQLAVAYQQKVLQAAEEAERGLVTFLGSQRRSRLLDESVIASEKAVKVVVAQYEAGAVDFNRYALIEQNAVQQQDAATQARGQITQGLIEMYRALGGGWEIRLDDGRVAEALAAAGMPNPAEAVPVPLPGTANAPAQPGAPQPPPPPNPPQAGQIPSPPSQPKP